MSIFKAKFVNVQYKNSNIKRKSQKFSTKVREIISSHPESKYHERKPKPERMRELSNFKAQIRQTFHAIIVH